MPPTDRPDGPDGSAAFAALSADLHAGFDEGVTAQTIVDRLTRLVPEADEVSLTIRTRGEHRTLAASGSMAHDADALQYALSEGPCIEVADGSAWLRSGDVASDPRWPRWGPAARELGVGSLLAVQLLDEDQPRGALNVYSRRTGSFADHDTIDLALIYAIHAASALSSARQVTHLQTALSSRHTIGMAQGIVMERFGLDEQQSFELMRRLASSGQLKLRDVAAHVVEHRTLPGVDPTATAHPAGRGEATVPE